MQEHSTLPIWHGIVAADRLVPFLGIGNHKEPNLKWLLEIVQSILEIWVLYSQEMLLIRSKEKRLLMHWFFMTKLKETEI